MKLLLNVIGGALLAWSASALAFDVANFGNVPIAGSKLVHHTVTNPQGAVALWPKMAIAGTNADNFFIVNDTCSGAAFVQTCTLDVLFVPNSLGPKGAYLVNPWTGDPSNPELLLGGTAIAAWTGGLDSFVPALGVTQPQSYVVDNVAVSGYANAFSLSVLQYLDSNSLGLFGSVFLGAYVPPYGNGSGLSSGGVFQPSPSALATSLENGTWYLADGAYQNNNRRVWRKFQGGQFSATYTGTLNSAHALVDVLRNADPASLCGTEFYVGYGVGTGVTQGDEMLARNTFGKFYKVMCNFDFHGYYSGPLNNFSLSAYAQVATAEAGLPGNFYVGRVQGNQWFFHNGTEWVEYHSGAIPVYNKTDALMTRVIEIYDHEDASFLVNSQVYVGYGRDEADLIGNNKFARVYP